MPSPTAETPGGGGLLDGPLPMRRGRWWWVPGIVLLMALVAFVLARHAEEERFLHLLRQARPGWLLVAVLLQLATYLCDGVQWQRVLRHTGVRAPVWGLARLSLMKLTFDQLIPTAGIGGSMMVARGLRKVGAAPGAAAAAILMTLLCFYAAQALSVGWSLVYLWSHEELDALVRWMATAFSGVAVAVPAIILLLAGREDWRPGPWLRRVPGLPALLRAVAGVPPRLLRDPPLLAQGTLLQVAVFVLDAATLGVLVRALGESTSLGTVFASFMMASVAQTVSFLPGGVGTFEAASVAMLSFLGLPVEAALTATLLFRGFTLWLPLLPGFYLLRWSLPGNERQDDHRPAAPPR
ncbi:MAG TPA: lysylphosphatidylglycerol synthase transmembrane domain-containing protein [Archangium sp.]|uniref:lysylphosphatidylglycerol synthase transmembrane domain-containing protein n=1 Tax=Archangium sp. TaxID=1872627 RepID=UPI002E31058D|nr:lysylphosphatidylglycerol synthase transmembrane domain-containing protein [Archangium sp.]HEX5747043.1 lysylphosphatidylglycerol synthase transmembrane domain-containing protein [Archangium sp.]